MTLRTLIDNSGIAGIELALAAPMLVLLMTAGYDFGSALYEQHRLVSAARAGVSYAIKSSTTWSDASGITAAVRADAGDTASRLTVTPTTCTCPGGASPCSQGIACLGSSVAGSYVMVTVSESYSTLVHYPFIGTPFTVSGVSLVRVQ